MSYEGTGEPYKVEEPEVDPDEVLYELESNEEVETGEGEDLESLAYMMLGALEE